MLGKNNNKKNQPQNTSQGAESKARDWNIGILEPPTPTPAHSTLQEPCTGHPQSPPALFQKKTHRKNNPKGKKKEKKNQNKQQLPVIGTALLKWALESAPASPHWIPHSDPCSPKGQDSPVPALL